ncbi:hypothetical protein F0U60_49850 [Archangium minus]|uniref:Lipoprotein n=1 Tax=Archangium minus TaxID=83450 RepID=A0ABY9X7J5_9BACT|nr:hypothetical protein F0U60_49850 [Archangium minus]
MRRVLALVLLLTVETACPHAWGREGTIDRALEQDMIEYYSMKECSLDEKSWMELCNDPSNPDKQRHCPTECRPPDEARR